VPFEDSSGAVSFEGSPDAAAASNSDDASGETVDAVVLVVSGASAGGEDAGPDVDG
jgi:hypothetical protein